MNINLWIVTVILNYCHPVFTKKTAVLFHGVFFFLWSHLHLNRRPQSIHENTRESVVWENASNEIKSNILKKKTHTDQQKGTKSIGKSSRNLSFNCHTQKSNWFDFPSEQFWSVSVDIIIIIDYNVFFFVVVFVIITVVVWLYLLLPSFAWISSSRIIDVYAIVRERFASGDRIWFQ